MGNRIPWGATMYECLKCQCPIRKRGLCAFCMGDAFTEANNRLRWDGKVCAHCKEPLRDDESIKVWWDVRGNTRAFNIHRKCEVAASHRATFTKDHPDSRRRDDAFWDRALGNKEMKLAPTFKPSHYAYFNKDRVGGFAVGKLLGARVVPPNANRDKEQKQVTIESRVMVPGGDGLPRAVDIQVLLTDIGCYNCVEPYITSKPGQPSLIGQWVCFLAPKLSADGRYANVTAYAASNLAALLSEVNASDDIAAMREVHGADFVVDFQTWYNGIELDIAKRPENYADPLNAISKPDTDIPF